VRIQIAVSFLYRRRLAGAFDFRTRVAKSSVRPQHVEDPPWRALPERDAWDGCASRATPTGFPDSPETNYQI